MSKLINKSYKDYSYVSRYHAFPYYYDTSNKKYVYGLTAYLDDTTVYQSHTVNKGDSFDSLALKYYNNPTLYWVICSFNHIQNPYMSLKEGSTIKIPSLSNIEYDKLGRS